MPSAQLVEKWAAAPSDGRKGKVTCVRLTAEQRELLNVAARARHERKRAGAGVGYVDGGRHRWTPMSTGEVMRELALEAARAELAGNTGGAPRVKGRCAKHGGRCRLPAQHPPPCFIAQFVEVSE